MLTPHTPLIVSAGSRNPVISASKSLVRLLNVYRIYRYSNRLISNIKRKGHSAYGLVLPYTRVSPSCYARTRAFSLYRYQAVTTGLAITYHIHVVVHTFDQL